MSTAIAPRSLPECEAVIERGLRSFVEVGEALTRIREKRLYEEIGYSSFEDYCRERWDMRRESADRFIRAAETMTVLNPIGLREPPCEAVVRELAPLREEPTVLRAAWTEVVQQHGAKPTAAQVREVVTEHREPKPERHVDYCPTCGHRIPAGRPLPQRSRN